MAIARDGRGYFMTLMTLMGLMGRFGVEMGSFFAGFRKNRLQGVERNKAGFGFVVGAEGVV